MKNLSYLKILFFRNMLAQIFFWCLANVFLVSFISMITDVIQESGGISVETNFSLSMITALSFGVIQGVVFGIGEFYFEYSFLRTQPFVVTLLAKTMIYFATTIGLMSIFRYVVYEEFTLVLTSGSRLQFSEAGWRKLFHLNLVYDLFAALVITFIIQVFRKFGPRMTLPFIFGRYRFPKEEDRVFLFMDLRASTTIAETLGHLRYSEFIRDCFVDISNVVTRHECEIYQYVGDEVIITWLTRDAIKDNACVRFFFDCEKQFQRRAAYYQERYGQTPVFKAAAHVGIVTTVEVGEIKRDLAFHGDAINAAARIQGLCNVYNRRFLLSRTLHNRLQEPVAGIESLGETYLKGKNIPIEIMSIGI